MRKKKSGHVRRQRCFNTPQIKECTLLNSKKIQVTFSKLMDPKSKLLTSKTSYNIFIDNKKVSSISSVKIDKKEEEARPNQNEVNRIINGVRSVVITSRSSLMSGQEIEVVLVKNLLDVDGNYTP